MVVSDTSNNNTNSNMVLNNIWLICCINNHTIGCLINWSTLSPIKYTYGSSTYLQQRVAEGNRGPAVQLPKLLMGEHTHTKHLGEIATRGPSECISAAAMLDRLWRKQAFHGFCPVVHKCCGGSFFLHTNVCLLINPLMFFPSVAWATKPHLTELYIHSWSDERAHLVTPINHMRVSPLTDCIMKLSKTQFD